MGNASNPEMWAAAERLRFIEKSAFWRGTVSRGDLTAVYGVSAAQATADLQKFQELNAGALIYSLNRKRYEGAPGMVCVRHSPCLEEAMEMFLGAAGAAAGGWALYGGLGNGGAEAGGIADVAAGGKVAGISLPARVAVLGVQRAVFLAVLQGLRLRVRYRSLSGRPEAWRWLAPRAFGHDGYRWHVRAWSEEHGQYRDWVLSRMVEVEWPTEAAAGLPVDEDWEKWVEVRLRANPELTEDQQAAVMQDFQLKGGKLVLKVRGAMLRYLRQHLGLPVDGRQGGAMLVEEGGLNPES